MRWKKNPSGRYSLAESIEIEAPVARVYDAWTHYERLPSCMESVRRTKQIDAGRVLWDVDIAGHQLVWEARILEVVPKKIIRWESSWGTALAGQVRFEAVDASRTRLSVEIDFRPKGIVESLGARLGYADRAVRRDLQSFRRRVQRVVREAAFREAAYATRPTPPVAPSATSIRSPR
jgi:uncharacterized membrane protein